MAEKLKVGDQVTFTLPKTEFESLKQKRGVITDLISLSVNHTVADTAMVDCSGAGNLYAVDIGDLTKIEPPEQGIKP